MADKGSVEWYGAMALAMKKREHAQSMVARWATKAAEAEEEIQQLANGTETATEQE